MPTRPGKKLDAQSRIFTTKNVIKSLGRKKFETKELTPATQTYKELDSHINNFQTSLDNVEVLVKRYTTPDENGYPILKESDLKKLSETYSEAIAQCDLLLSYKNNQHVKNNVNFKVIAEMTRKTRDYLILDSKALVGANAKIGQTLPEALENSRTPVISIDDTNIDPAKGGSMSSRLPIEISAKNGYKISGMFTKTVKYDFMDRSNNIIKKFMEIASDDDTKNFLKNFILKKEDIEKVNGKSKFLFAFWNKIALGASLNDLRDILNNQKGMKDKFAFFTDDKQEEVENYINSIRPEADKLYCSYLMNSERLGLKDGTNLDKRNYATSLVANLLGRPDLVANAISMTINCKGQKHTGTFMEFVKGASDMAHLDKDDPALKCDISKGIDGRPVLKDMADLQVLDYICGNVDRHYQNMLYITETKKNGKVVLKGIKAIDNDGSFPRTDLSKGFNRLSSVSGMKVISESMARAIYQLNRNTLELTLQGAGLTSDVIEGAMERLDHIKKAIINNKIKVVGDSQWKNYTLDDLTKRGSEVNRGSGVFQEVKDCFKQENRMRMVSKVNKPGYKKNEFTMKAASFEGSNEQFIFDSAERFSAKVYIDSVVSDLNKSKDVWFGSSKYTDMLKSAKTIQKEVETCSLARFEELAKDLKQKTDAYLERKFLQSPEKANRINSVNRILAATSAIDFSAKFLDKIELSAWDEYKIQNKDYNMKFIAKKQFEEMKKTQELKPAKASKAVKM